MGPLGHSPGIQGYGWRTLRGHAPADHLPWGYLLTLLRHTSRPREKAEKESSEELGVAKVRKSQAFGAYMQNQGSARLRAKRHLGC